MFFSFLSSILFGNSINKAKDGYKKIPANHTLKSKLKRKMNNILHHPKHEYYGLIKSSIKKCFVGCLI